MDTAATNFLAISALLESLSDRDNERLAETSALLTAVSLLAFMLHARGAADLRDYGEALRQCGGSELARKAKLAKIAEAVDELFEMATGPS